MNNVVLIAAVEAEEAARSKQSESLIARARAAMEAVQHHWMATKEDDQFLAACEGLARTCSDEERERVEADLRKLQRAAALINALESGVTVDWEAMATEAEAEKDQAAPLGLRSLWQEVRSGSVRSIG